MKKLMVCFLVMLMVIAAASQAFAQYGETSRFTLKAGVYQPSGSILRNDGSSTWMSIGLNYDLSQDEYGRTLSAIALERASQGGMRFEGQMTAAQYMLIRHQGSDEHRGAYVGAGGGIYLLKAERAEDLVAWPIKPKVNESGIKPGVVIVGGYNVSEMFFAEIRYAQVGSIGSGMNFSGLTLNVGARGIF